MRVFLAVLIFAGVAAGQSLSSTWHGDGNSLLTYCGLMNKESKTDSDWQTLWYWLGYIEGIININTVMSIEKVHPKYLCVPNSVTHGQEVQVVVKYSNDNPAKLHYHAAFLVFSALLNAFPCKK